MDKEELIKRMHSNLEDLNPILKKMTELLMDAYEKGFMACFNIFEGIVNDNNNN